MKSKKPLSLREFEKLQYAVEISGLKVDEIVKLILKNRLKTLKNHKG